jgi:hypothetical protein
MFIAELFESTTYITRIDNHPIANFSANMGTYHTTADASASDRLKPGEEAPAGTTTQQGVYAGDPHFTALYATGNADQTRYVARFDGQPTVWFDKKDVPRIRGHRSYVTVFDAKNFKKLPSGEYFSSKPGKPLKQVEITDPFQYLRNNGWEFRFTNDLPGKLKELQASGAKFGSEGFGTKPVTEITMVPTVAKSKREHLDVMPNDGRPIPPGEEAEHLGKPVADMGRGLELWSWASHGTVTYYVFDTATRTSQLGTTGRPYTTNRNSFVVQGVYSGPKNQYRAADLYAFLILNQGLTLVSDNKQSAGGYRVWQELERRYGRKINVHGFDTRTNKPVNVTTQDEPETHVARDTVKKAGPQMKKELGTISRDLRFVASAR